MGQSGSSMSSCTRDSRSGVDTDLIDIYANASRHEILEEVCTPDEDLLENQPQQVLLDIQRKEVAEADIDSSTVILHIYDVNATLSAANNVLAFSGRDIAVGGAFHTGLEAYGSEWSYGTAGVTSIAPRTADHIYRCSMVLGQTTLIQWVAELHEMCQTWRGQEYNLLGGYNCNSFVAELCQRLGVGPVPAWVDRFSRLAKKGRDASKRVFRGGGSDSESGLVKRDRDKIAAELDPRTHRDGDAVFKLPETQIAVKGQKVALKIGDEDIPEKSQQDELMETCAPVYVKSRGSVPSPQKSTFIEDSSSDAAQHLRRAEENRASLPRCDAWHGHEETTSQLERCASLAPDRRIPQLQRSGSVETNAEIPATDYSDYLDRQIHECRYPVGSSVEYYSSTQNTWICAQVLDFDSYSGLYELTCKSQVHHQKIRTPQKQSSQNPPPSRKWFPPGHNVEYESASAEGCWIPAVVVAYYSDTGLYDLDVKPQATREKIRPVEDFPVNAEVEYRSTSAGQNLGWIPGHVLSFDAATGLYDLTCKAKVGRARIRFAIRENV